jgi:hypothetical protein
MISKLELQTKLSNIFHIGFNFITAENTPKPKWRTNRKYRLTRGEFVKRYSDELTLLGVSFSTTTKYFMLDIDQWSKYHPARDLPAFKKICQILEKLGLVSLDIIRSSDSQGIHLYGWLPEAVSTIRLATLLHVNLIDAGINIAKGQLECFPNPKPYGEKGNYTYYNSHRLPLQPNTGGLLLDQDGEIILTAENLTHQNMLAGFLRRVEQSAQAQDMELLHRLMDRCYAKYTSNKGIAKYQHHHKDYTEVAREWKENLELTIQTIGWTAHGQTNTLLPNFIAYGTVFLGLKSEELENRIYDLILAAPGYQEYCRHKHEIKSVIKDWVKNTERQDYYVEYCGFPARSGISPHTIARQIKISRNEHNQNIAKRTEQRLKTILSELKELPKKIGDKIKLIQAKSAELYQEIISRTTLYKKAYKQLWQDNRLPIIDLEVIDLEAIDLELETQKDPTPSINSPQSITAEHSQQINPKNNSQILLAQIQSQQQLSYTPPIYETYVGRLGFQNLHHYIHSYCINLLFQFILVSGFLVHQADLEPNESNLESLSNPESNPELLANIPESDNLLTATDNTQLIEISASHSSNCSCELDSELTGIVELTEEVDSEQTFLISVGVKLRRNIQQVGKKTYPALSSCVVVSSNGLDWVVRDPDGSVWNVSQHSLVTGLWEIETSVDVSELLAGGLPDLQTTAASNIRSVVEVARAVRANISGIDDELLLEFLHHPQQTEIQELIELGDELAASQTCDSVQAVVSNLCRREKMDLWRVLRAEERSVVEKLMAAVVPVRSVAVVNEFTAGVVVATLTGLIGVIRHVFKSVAKPFVVYHEELNRTIRYDLDDLRFNA